MTGGVISTQSPEPGSTVFLRSLLLLFFHFLYVFDVQMFL